MTTKTLKTLILAQFLTLIANCATVSQPDECICPPQIQEHKANPFQNSPEAPKPPITQEEAQAIVSQARIDLEADQLVSDPSQWQLLISSYLCAAQILKNQTEDKLRDYIDWPLLNAKKKADKSIESAKGKLDALDLHPLPCTSYDVDSIAQCLESIPPTYCYKNPHIQAQVQASEKLNTP